jgi:hypothetical protein
MSGTLFFGGQMKSEMLVDGALFSIAFFKVWKHATIKTTTRFQTLSLN